MLIVVVDESVFVMVPSAARLPVLVKVVCTAAARTTMLLRSIDSPVGSVPVWWIVLLALWLDCLVPVVIDVPVVLSLPSLKRSGLRNSPSSLRRSMD